MPPSLGLLPSAGQILFIFQGPLLLEAFPDLFSPNSIALVLHSNTTEGSLCSYILPTRDAKLLPHTNLLTSLTTTLLSPIIPTLHVKKLRSPVQLVSGRVQPTAIIPMPGLLTTTYPTSHRTLSWACLPTLDYINTLTYLLRFLRLPHRTCVIQLHLRALWPEKGQDTENWLQTPSLTCWLTLNLSPHL